jgi:hypothetical protein
MPDVRNEIASALSAITADAFERLAGVDAARKVEDRLVEDLWLELRRSAYPTILLQRRGGTEPGDLVCPGVFIAEFKLAYRGEHGYPGDLSWRGSARHDLARLRALSVPTRVFVQILSFGPSGQYQRFRGCACADDETCLAAWASAFEVEGISNPLVARRGFVTMLLFEV